MRKALLALVMASSLNPSHLLDSLWHLLSWGTSPEVTKEGCGADPNGRCAPVPTTGTQLDGGCGGDPNGHCNPGS